jgi:hypothetical protein
MKIRIPSSVILTIFFLAILLSPHHGYAEETTIVLLTQTPCTIIEAEEEPMEFESKSIEDCQLINEETADDRVLIPLVLKPGKTIFRVANENVPYELGFWLRGAGLKRLTLPSVSGGGLHPGEVKDYVVDLKPGKYLYSCPLNPTPDYPLTVEEIVLPPKTETEAAPEAE